MPLFREENFLIIHAGSEETLFLFGLQDTLFPPQYKIPTVVYLDKSTNEYHFTNTGDLEEIHPIQLSRIVDVEALQALIKFILQTIIARHPILTINQVPLLLIVPSNSYSRLTVELITKFVFENLELTAFNIFDLSVAASYGIGATSSALVVNIGHEATQIVPVVGGTTIKFASKRLNVGGKTIDDALKGLLPRLTAPQITALKRSAIFEVLHEDQNAFYSLDDLAAKSEEGEFDVAKIVVEGENGIVPGGSPEGSESKKNSEIQSNSFMFGDQKILVEKERFMGTNELINAISEGIYESLKLVPDLEKRHECYDNIVIVGGTSNIAGLKQAIVLKLNQNYLNRPPTGKKAKGEPAAVNSAIAAYQLTDETGDGSTEHGGNPKLLTSIKLAKFPEYFPEWKEPKFKGGSWADVYVLGGEIYAKQIFGGNSNHGGDSFIDTDIYEERGPQAIWDVCL